MRIGRTRALDVFACEHPLPSQLRQALTDVATLRSARIVDAQRRLAAVQCDLTHWNAHVVPCLDVYLARIRECIFEAGGCESRAGSIAAGHADPSREGNDIAAGGM